MRKLLKWLGLTLGATVLLLAGFVGFVAMAPLPTYEARPPALKVEVTPERVARGKRHAELLCAGCHFDSGTGALTGKRMLDLPAQFGRAYSKNITGTGPRASVNGPTARSLSCSAPASAGTAATRRPGWSGCRTPRTRTSRT